MAASLPATRLRMLLYTAKAGVPASNKQQRFHLISPAVVSR